MQSSVLNSARPYIFKHACPDPTERAANPIIKQWNEREGDRDNKL